MWLLDVAFLPPRRDCSPDVAILQTWLFSSGCSLDVAALYVAVLQTWLFFRRGYSPNVAILQTWFSYLALLRGLVILGQLGIR
ncbi:hypothetical protein V2W45_1389109 [Cenococcum geophilum]